MIFVSGVHGVGKSYFCKLVKDSVGIETYSASALISAKKRSGFAKDKLIPDIDENQQFLLWAVDELRTLCQNFILDGHFCLLNASGEVQRVPYDTFAMLKPDAIVLLTENPEIIASRRKRRDGIEVAIESIKYFQREERLYANEVAGNVNWMWLKSNDCWPGTHPMNFRYTRSQFEKILREGKVDVSNVIIN